MLPSFRWLAPSVLALSLGVAGWAAPSTARADDDLIRVIVDVADVIYHGGNPYYRHGNYGPYDRIIVERGPYGRPVYYRYVDRRYGPPYGNAWGHYKKRDRYWDQRRAYQAGYRDGRRDDRRWDRDDRRRSYSASYRDGRRWDDRRWDDRRWDRDDD